MAENICRNLNKEKWKSYASDLDEAPKKEGMYAIGRNDRVMYVGRSKNINQRLKGHKHQNLKVDKFIKKQFNSNGGKNLQYKYVLQPKSKCTEGLYIKCMKKELEYPLKYNMKGGDTCKRSRSPTHQRQRNQK